MLPDVVGALGDADGVTRIGLRTHELAASGANARASNKQPGLRRDVIRGRPARGDLRVVQCLLAAILLSKCDGKERSGG